MRILLLLALFGLLGFEGIRAFRGPFSKLLPDPKNAAKLQPGDDPGEPLFLTPYLEQGKIDEARRLR